MASSTKPRARDGVDGALSAPSQHAGLQWLLVLVVAILALNGVDLAWRSVMGGGATAAAGASRTSFGSLAVTGVESLGGLSAADVSGMTHGLPGFVSADQEGVVVEVSLVNDSARKVRIEPGEFTLLVNGRNSAPAGGTIASVVLQPGASLEGRLSFVVPRAAATATLRFDEGNGSVALLDLGLITTGPAPSEDPLHAH
jgi:hypothetical protein